MAENPQNFDLLHINFFEIKFIGSLCRYVLKLDLTNRDSEWSGIRVFRSYTTQLLWVYYSSDAISAFMLWEQLFKVPPCWLV